MQQSKLIKSQQVWRKKAVQRAEALRIERKLKKYHQKRAIAFKKEVEQLKQEINELKKNQRVQHQAAQTHN